MKVIIAFGSASIVLNFISLVFTMESQSYLYGKLKNGDFERWEETFDCGTT